MKVDDFLELNLPGEMEFKLNSSGATVMTLEAAGKPVVSVAGITADNFTEEFSLPQKLRCHRSNDGLSAEFDSVTVIPFGCEYTVRRQWTLFNGCALLNCDIAPDNGGMIRKLELEPVTIALEAAKLEYLVYGDEALRSVDKPSGEIYCGNEIVVMFRVTSPDGQAVEFYAGDDLWRHRAGLRGGYPGVANILEVTPAGVQLKRTVFDLPEDAACEKRPWKFKSMIAWSLPAKAETLPEVNDSVEIKECFTSPNARRALRKFIRRSRNMMLEVKGDFPGVCSDPAHLERSGSTPCEHGDLGALAADYLWSSREAAKLGSSVVFNGDGKIFGDSAALKNFRMILEKLY